MTDSQSSVKTSPNEALTRLPVLDGLRGLAILLVLLYHFYRYGWIKLYLDYFSVGKVFALADFGWSGVDLFFALSGFLITSILFRTKDSPDYFRSFYGRRFLRILPLYFLCIFPMFHMQRFPHLQQAMGSLPNDREIWFWTYLANWKIPIWRDNYLTHFWSLCVEEQFYLAWPLVVWLTSRRRFPWVCGGIVTLALSFGLGMEFAGFGREYIQYASFPRAEAIVFGSIIAWLAEEKMLARFATIITATLPLAAIAMLFVAVHHTYFRGLYVLETVVAGVGWSLLLFFCIASPGAILTRALSHRFLRMMGSYSYAMYCLNFIVLRFVGRYARQALGMLFLSEATPLKVLLFFIITMAATIAAGFLSWHLLEKHFLRLRQYFPYRSAQAGPHTTQLPALAAKAAQ